MKAVIMAGGKGTRLSSITDGVIPKSMVSINGIPILEYQIRLLIRYRIEEVIIITGFLHTVIENYFGNGDKFGLPITYIIEDTPKGTGGRLPLLEKYINDDFIVLFGDLVCDFSIQRMLEAHIKKNALITLFAHPNAHPFDSDLLVIDEGHKVTGYYSKHETRQKWHKNLVNAGIYIINPRIFSLLPKKEVMDLEKDIIFPFCNQGNEIVAYISTEYVKDIGTPDRLQAAEHDMNTGIIQKKNLDNPQKCIFLDRDGTLNKLNGLIYDPEQLELEETAANAIKEINNSDYLAIVITNQPVVARGLCSENTVAMIHNKLETLLGAQGAYLDGIYYCPHHPDTGYEGENVKYKIACHCRKPDIGLIEDCVRHFNISLKHSFFIGDSTGDIQTGKNAGLKTVLLKTGEAGLDKKYDVYPDYIADTVFCAVKKILEKE
ncbi:MAG: HAD-IIIA family hydrolase [Termitinemataceae bacterium]|nr:MAG: HAD-IIIA family hydrolase [Termitinemataceae bacterium]